jgi:hypothetical protein
MRGKIQGRFGHPEPFKSSLRNYSVAWSFGFPHFPYIDSLFAKGSIFFNPIPKMEGEMGRLAFPPS